jgi:hypothetical protein
MSEPVPTPATPAAAAVSAVPVAGPPPAAAVPTAQTVTIPLEQLQAFTSIQTRLAQMETDQRARDEAARTETVRLMAAKGDVENALRTLREQAEKDLKAERDKLTATEERARRYALDGELARSLASHALVPGGAEQLTQLWRSQLVVQPQGDSFSVTTPTFQPVGDFIAAQLGRPEYAHFVRAQNPGGGTAGGTTVQTPHTQAANPVAELPPRSMGEAILRGIKAAQKDAPDPRISGGTFMQDDGSIKRQPSAAFGLRPLARQG